MWANEGLPPHSDYILTLSTSLQKHFPYFHEAWLSAACWNDWHDAIRCRHSSPVSYKWGKDRDWFKWQIWQRNKTMMIRRRRMIIKMTIMILTIFWGGERRWEWRCRGWRLRARRWCLEFQSSPPEDDLYIKPPRCMSVWSRNLP